MCNWQYNQESFTFSTHFWPLWLHDVFSLLKNDPCSWSAIAFFPFFKLILPCYFIQKTDSSDATSSALPGLLGTSGRHSRKGHWKVLAQVSVSASLWHSKSLPLVLLRLALHRGKQSKLPAIVTACCHHNSLPGCLDVTSVISLLVPECKLSHCLGHISQPEPQITFSKSPEATCLFFFFVLFKVLDYIYLGSVNPQETPDIYRRNFETNYLAM